MPKAGFIPQQLKPWIEARKRYRLSHAQVQMARELGLNPKKFRKLSSTDQSWKVPLPQYIEHLYQKRFGRTAPEDIRSIEEKVAAKKKRKSKRKESKNTGSRDGAESDS